MDKTLICRLFSVAVLALTGIGAFPASASANNLVCELKTGQESGSAGSLHVESLHFETYNTDPLLSTTWLSLFGTVPGMSPHDVLTLQPTDKLVHWEAGELVMGGTMTLSVKAQNDSGLTKIKIENAGKYEGMTTFISGTGGVNPNLAPGGWHAVKIKRMDNVSAVIDGMPVTGFMETLEVKLDDADASGRPTVKDFKLEMLASSGMAEIKKGTVSSVQVSVPATRITAHVGVPYEEKIKSGPKETLGHTEAEHDREGSNSPAAADLSSLHDGFNDRLYERKGACQVNSGRPM